MDFWNSNIVATITGAIVGGLIAIVASIVTYRMQRKDAEKKEIRENFKNKAELSINEWFKDNGDNTKELYVIPCPYIAKLNNEGFIDTEIPKAYSNKEKLKREIIYLENIGKSDINELEIAIADPKNAAILNAKTANDFIKKGLISYGVKLDRKIRIGEAVELIIYYDEKALIDDIFSASIEIYYRDSINNVCAQPLFIKERKIYEPRLIDYSEWREQVSVDKNLEHWKRRLTEHKS